MYSHPSVTIPAEVEHKDLPGILLRVVSGPRVTPTGNIQYLVTMPDGKVVPVLKKNLVSRKDSFRARDSEPRPIKKHKSEG